jgi:hypothetical protein
MGKNRRLLDEYQFPGFRPKAGMQGVFGDPRARVIRLERTQKKQSAAVVARHIGAITTKRFAGYGTYPAGTHESIWRWRFGGYYAGSAER